MIAILCCGRLCYFAYFSMLCHSIPTALSLSSSSDWNSIPTALSVSLLLHSVYQAMGAIDWQQCQYCEYWDIHARGWRQPDGLALCAWCWDFDLEGGIFESEEHWWCFSQFRLRRERYLHKFRILPVVLRISKIINTISWY